MCKIFSFAIYRQNVCFTRNSALEREKRIPEDLRYFMNIDQLVDEREYENYEQVFWFKSVEISRGRVYEFLSGEGGKRRNEKRCL